MTSALTGHVFVGKRSPLYITTTATLPVNSFDTVVSLLTAPSTLNLPALASCPNNYKVIIRNDSVGATTLTVQGNGSELIGSSNTAAVAQNQGFTIMVDHIRSKWQILSTIG